LKAYTTYFNFFTNTLPRIDAKSDEEDYDIKDNFIIGKGRLPMLIGSIDRCCSDIEWALSALGFSPPEGGVIKSKRNH
jgi:hypothetical protein